MRPTQAHIRLATREELPQVQGLVDDIMGQVYAHLLGDISLVPTDPAHWQNSWVVVTNTRLLGVGMTQLDQVRDLWLHPQARGLNLGSRLLEILESEILQRGYARAKLRVVAENSPARAFYTARGWQEKDAFAHEKLRIPMLNLSKELPASGSSPNI